MSQGADTLKTAPSAPPADSPLSNEPPFKVSEGDHPDPTAPETEGLQVGFQDHFHSVKNMLIKID
jgi:hypothetical protein